MNPVFKEQASNIPMLDLMKMMRNPKAMMESPQVKTLLQQYGTPKAAFYAICKQRNVDPEQILSMAKQFK